MSYGERIIDTMKNLIVIVTCLAILATLYTAYTTIVQAKQQLDQIAPAASVGIHCKDGTTSKSTTRQGACANHGGIA